MAPNSECTEATIMADIKCTIAIVRQHGHHLDCTREYRSFSAGFRRKLALNCRSAPIKRHMISINSLWHLEHRSKIKLREARTIHFSAQWHLQDLPFFSSESCAINFSCRIHVHFYCSVLLSDEIKCLLLSAFCNIM